MPRIALQYLIKPNTTPEQELLLEHFYNRFDNGSAANRQIINVEPLYFEGAIAGTEFLVYAATKLYICYNCSFTSAVIANVNINYIQFYDENDVFYYYSRESAVVYDAVSIKYFPNTAIENNLYFSRFSNAGYTYMKFTGYRITLI